MSIDIQLKELVFPPTKIRFDYPDFLEVQVKSFQRFFSVKNHS